MSIEARFRAKIDRGVHWRWMAAIDRSGRTPVFNAGHTHINDKGEVVASGTSARRYAYEKYIGTIPKGHIVYASCGEASCVRPEHLETRKGGWGKRPATGQTNLPLRGV